MWDILLYRVCICPILWIVLCKLRLSRPEGSNFRQTRGSTELGLWFYRALDYRFSWRLETFRTDASSRLEAGGSLHSRCESSLRLCSPGLEPWFSVMKGKQMKFESSLFCCCRNRTLGYWPLRVQVQVFLFKDPTENLMKAKKMHTGVSLCRILGVPEMPGSCSIGAKVKDPYISSSAREGQQGGTQVNAVSQVSSPSPILPPSRP